MNCTYQYFKDIEFDKFPINETKGCIYQKSLVYGAKIFPGSPETGLLIILAIFIILGYLIFRRKKG